jgi:ribosome-binding factor A
VTPDLKKVHVYYSVMGDEARRAELAGALEKAKGFIRRSLAGELTIKYVPELIFEFDRNLAYVEHMNQIFSELNKKQEDPRASALDNDSK